MKICHILCVRSGKGWLTWGKIYPVYKSQALLDKLIDSIYQLLVFFCDASTKSYAAIVYLRIVSSKSFRVNVYSKGRLAPLDSKNRYKHGRKHVTLPRLELLVVMIGVRVINFVTSELKLLITKRVLFTDSECVLRTLD